MALSGDRIFNIEDTHKFEIDGTKILLDVNSGSVHEIDDLTWRILDGMAANGGDLAAALAGLALSYGEGELAAAEREIRLLAEEGSLFTTDEYRDTFTPPAAPVLKSLCLNISHDCNLRCAYCFAGTGDFGGGRLMMSEEVGRRAIDFLMANSGNRRHCEIDFFGGEPLMNFEVVKALIAYGREQGEKFGKNIKFTVTTNGVALNQGIRDYLNREEISVVLSLDGRPEVNDRVRRFPGGQGSYGIIKENIKEFVRQRKNGNYYIRGTYTGWNKDFSQDVRHLVEEGFEIISLEPVVSKEDAPYALQMADLPQLRGEYLKLARFYLAERQAGRPFTFFHFNLDLDHGPCLPKRLTGCGAGHEYMVITPDGDIYPCHQFVGREGFRLGSLDAPQLNEGMRKEFQRAHIYNKPRCRACWARFYCSGGCHANAQAATGDIFQPYELGCELQKMRLESAIWLQVLEADRA